VHANHIPCLLQLVNWLGINLVLMFVSGFGEVRAYLSNEPVLMSLIVHGSVKYLC